MTAQVPESAEVFAEGSRRHDVRDARYSRRERAFLFAVLATVAGLVLFVTFGG